MCKNHRLKASKRFLPVSPATFLYVSPLSNRPITTLTDFQTGKTAGMVCAWVIGPLEISFHEPSIGSGVESLDAYSDSMNFLHKNTPNAHSAADEPQAEQLGRSGSLSTLPAEAATFALSSTADSDLGSVASQIVLSLERKDGLWRLVVPEGVRDVDALTALQSSYLQRYRQLDESLVLSHLQDYLQKAIASQKWRDSFARVPYVGDEATVREALGIYRSMLSSPLFSDDDLRWYASLESVESRDCSRPRTVSLVPIVIDTINKTYEQQRECLAAARMRFADPIEQALVAAAFAYSDFRSTLRGSYFFEPHNCGVDLPTWCTTGEEPTDFYVRGAIPGVVITASRDRAFSISDFVETGFGSGLAASGVPLEPDCRGVTEVTASFGEKTLKSAGWLSRTATGIQRAFRPFSR